MNSKERLFDLVSEKSELDFFLSSIMETILLSDKASQNNKVSSKEMIHSSSQNTEKSIINAESIFINDDINQKIHHHEPESNDITINNLATEEFSKKITEQEVKNVTEQDDKTEKTKDKILQTFSINTEQRKTPIRKEMNYKTYQSETIWKKLILKIRKSIWVVAGGLLILIAMITIYLLISAVIRP